MRNREAGLAPVRPRRTVCTFCGTGCAMLLSPGASYPALRHPVSQGALCIRGWSAGELLASPLRLRTARLRRDHASAETVPVERALAEVAQRLKGIRERHGGGAIGILGSARITVEEAASLRRLARALGTPHLDTLQRIGYLPLPALPLEAIETASRVTVLGANATVRQPQVARRLLRALDRGARLRFVHSRRPQLAGLLAEHIVALPGHELGRLEPPAEDEVVVVASELALSGQGAETARRLAGRRALFLTDYVNQRGVIEAGLHPTPAGLSAWEMLNAAADGTLRALLVFADDPFEFFPALAARAFARAELTMVADAVSTRTVARAGVALPGALLAEKSGTVVNTEGRAQELVPVVPPPAGWTEGGYAAELARRLGGGDDALPEPAPFEIRGASLPADTPSAEYPFLAALDTTLFWNSHALVGGTITAWREARSLFADFPPGCVTLNPDDARRLGVAYASVVSLESPDGATTLPARIHPRMLPGTVWIAMRCWESCGSRLGALAYDPSLRIPVFRPRAVRVARAKAR